MNPDQIRARLAEINAALEGYGDQELTDAQMGEIDAYHAEFEGLEKKLEAAEKLASVKARANRSTGRKVTPATPEPAAAVRVEVAASEKERKFGGFDSSADYLMAVVDAGKTGKIAKQFQNAMYEKSGEDGGWLVPEDIRTDIQKKLDTNDQSLWGKARTFPVSGNTLSLPIDESQPWNSGVQVYWTGEGRQILDSKPKLTSAHLRLHKLAALVNISDELLEDAPALEAYVGAQAPTAIMHKVNSAMLTGDGVGKPQGIINSPYAVTVAKEVGQAADSIVVENLIKMVSRIIPGSNPIWMMNAGVVEALRGLQDANGRYIFLSANSDLNGGPFSTLLGYPVLPMIGSLPGIGDTGDIILADWNAYFGIYKQSGVKQAQSIHLYFDRDMTSFRFTMRLDGQCPFKTPVTTEFGGYQVSSFVMLAPR